MSDKRTYYEVIVITKDGEQKKIWSREFYTTGTKMHEIYEVERKKYEAQFDFMLDYELLEYENPFSEKGIVIPLILKDDCRSVFWDDMTPRMEYLLDMVGIHFDDIITIYYTTECYVGDKTVFFEEIKIDETEANKMFELN